MKTVHALDPRWKQDDLGLEHRLVGVLLLALATACAPTPEDFFVEGDFASAPAPLAVVNGLTTNGLTTNGLTTNGLTTNGLTTNGLSTPSFAQWFNGNAAAYSDMVMKYVVGCAVASGTTRTWTNPSTGISYSWPGNLGLTPGWAAGNPITVPEQQLITACLAAHVNKYGRTVLISILGTDANGTPLPYDATELFTYSAKEGAFFGNLFNGAGVFACSDRNLNAQESTVRACALSAQSSGTSSECAPIVIVGNCNSACTKSDSLYWSSCSYGGVTYLPLTTRLLPTDIYHCGDGACQFTESCGNSNRYNSCQADCGSC